MNYIPAHSPIVFRPNAICMTDDAQITAPVKQEHKLCLLKQANSIGCKYDVTDRSRQPTFSCISLIT